MLASCSPRVPFLQLQLVGLCQPLDDGGGDGEGRSKQRRLERILNMLLLLCWRSSGGGRTLDRVLRTVGTKEKKQEE